MQLSILRKCSFYLEMSATQIVHRLFSAKVVLILKRSQRKIDDVEWTTHHKIGNLSNNLIIDDTPASVFD